MEISKKFLFILIVFLFVNIAVVSASDSNSTEIIESDFNNSVELEQIVIPADSVESNGTDESDLQETATSSSEVNETNTTEKTVIKTTPLVTIDSKKVNSKDTLTIYLKNSSGNPLKSKKFTATINNKEYSLKTNSKGLAKLKIDLAAKNYKLTISFNGDSRYNPVTKNFNIKVIKLKTKITQSANFVVKGKYLYFYLTDSNGNPVSSKKIIVKFKGKKFTKKTNSKGKIKLKMKSRYSKYSIKLNFKGDKQYKSSSKKLKFYVTASRLIKIGNSKLIPKGYMRVYLKIDGRAVSKKVKLIIGGKKFTKKANSEGIAVFKPNLKVHHYVAKVKVGKYYSSKPIKCYNGKVKDPLKEKVAYKNGHPDVDLMPKSYVMGDNNAKYTLKKSQYKEVLKRDSYCLFLNGKLTKYTFFKTKSHPKLNHIIKRTKWNVIEREINKKLVQHNKKGYWPGKISVSLKGKSYTYPEVRDAQNTGYTCGPASASMCSQVLKNYVCEKYLAKLGGTKKSEGTKCSGIKKSLEKNNFKCTYYYKASFKDALKKLKKGGCALIFHANRHYVSILDISSNGKKVLVSNSYGSYDNIPTKWVKVSYMKTKFSHWEESLIVKLNYKLSSSTKKSVNSYYTSFGTNWHKHNTHQSIGRI